MSQSALTPVEMLARLVAFPTVSSRSNLDLVEFVRSWLTAHGANVRLLPTSDGQKASLIATIGPMVPGGVVLSGHSDVVPVTEGWSGDPFVLRERDGHLIGRGACDMKGFVAAALAAVPAWQAMDLKRPIHIALSRDEEIGCIGAAELAQAMSATLPHPEAVIVGEPSMMKVIEGHKGSYSFITRVKGKSGHSSRMDLGVSAVMNGAAVAAFVADMLEENMRHPMAGGFLPPYTTLHCGIIQGGTAANVIADHCELVTDFRLMPGEGPEIYIDRIDTFIRTRLLPRMQAIAADTGFERVPRSDVPPLAPEPDGRAAKIALAAGADGVGVPVSYATEAGFFQKVGWSVVVCGPGDIAQAHTVDEYLSRAQLESASALMNRLGQDLCR